MIAPQSNFTPREEMLMHALRDLLPFLEAERDQRCAGGMSEYLDDAVAALDTANGAIAACTCTECGTPVAATSAVLNTCPPCALRVPTTCPECKGEGRTRANCRCETCDGKGWIGPEITAGDTSLTVEEFALQAPALG
jgi:hypothetical protein